MNIAEIHKQFLDSNGICTDTRMLKKGQLFIALKGDNFDGNKYALDAIKKGASMAIVDDNSIKHPKAVIVKDALKTLQDLAKFHRLFLNIPIIALTGSNGKTTTKELINAVLSTQYNCIATKGNLNNHIGVPLTLLTMNKQTEIGVVEMGANHLNEIALLSEIAQPNYAYITNIGKAHLEGFGSEENILIGKTELYKFIKNNNGIVFCNADDQKLYPLAKKIDSSLFFSKDPSNGLQIKLSSKNPFLSIETGSNTINSNLIGEYNFTNIAASVAIGKHFEITCDNIKKGIEHYTPKNNRSELISKGSNDIILDAYNANPSSMEAAIKNFNNTITKQKYKAVILGDMFELGDYSVLEHQKIIDLILSSKIEHAYLTGNHFSKQKIISEKISFFKDTKSLILQLKNNPITNSLLLIKGSRGMKLEDTLHTFE